MLCVDSAGEDVVVDKQSVLPVKEQLGVVVDLFKRTMSGRLAIIQILQPCWLYTDQYSYIKILDLKTWVWEKNHVN